MNSTTSCNNLNHLNDENQAKKLAENTSKFLSNIKQELKQTQSEEICLEIVKSSRSEVENALEKCPICLQKFSFKSKSYSSTCFHSYCFECLLEWTKIRYSCPLCKQAFDRIIYDVKSNLDYKEYFLKPKNNESLHVPLEIIGYLPPPTLSNYYTPELMNNYSNNQNFKNPHVRSKASWIVNKESSPIEFRMLVYKNGWYVNSLQIQQDIKITNIELEFNDESININTDSNECEFSGTSLITTQYKQATRFRESSPRWFNRNPACTHRLLNFLAREAKALYSLTRRNQFSINRTALTENVLKLIKEVETDSPEFLRDISLFIKPIRYAHHFVHEFSAYIKSACHDLFDYDAKCVYYENKSAIPQMFKPNKNDIFPFESLPVNLSKYRLNADEEKNFQTNCRDLEMPLIISDSEQVNIEQEESLSIINHHRNSESEHSSFCEEFIPSPKPPPECIVLSSSDNEQNRSSIKKSSSRKHKHKRKSSRHRSHSSKRHRDHHSKKKSKRKSEESSSLSPTSSNTNRKRLKKSKKKRSKSKHNNDSNCSSIEETN